MFSAIFSFLYDVIIYVITFGLMLSYVADVGKRNINRRPESQMKRLRRLARESTDGKLFR